MSSRTLAAVFAHGDDETAVAPALARYAREGVSVYLVVVTDGAQGGAHTAIPRGPELARARAEEVRCAAAALGIHPPILLGFPDGELGSRAADSGRLHRLTQRLHQELQRLRADALVTYGPEGATGHPDHRLVSSIVTQLVRSGAPGVPERLFYVGLPVEAFRAMSPQRGEPPLLVPRPKYFSLAVTFTEADLLAARKAMACHRTQFRQEVVERVHPALGAAWNGTLPLAPASAILAGSDLFE